MPRPPKDPSYEAILERLNRELEAGAAAPAPDAGFSAPLLVLGGLMRSGTTLVYQLLAASGAFVYPSNVIARFYRRPVVGWRVERLLEPFLPPRDQRFRSEAGRTEAWHEPHELGYFWHHHLPFERHHEPSEEVLEALDRTQLARELAALQGEDGRPLVVKNPILGFVYGWLLDRIPEARMVWVARRPLDVAASIYRTRRSETGRLDRWWSTRPADFEALAARPPEEQVAVQVARLLAAGAAARERHADRWLEVEYEAVCRDPGRELERIAVWTGAPGVGAVEVEPFRPSGADLEPEVLERLAAALLSEGVPVDRPFAR